MATQLTIIGAGPGGYVAAIRAAQLGAEVTVVEADNVGGTCLNWGCIPSKVMITSAELLQKFRHADSFGINVAGDVSIDMARLMTRKQAVIDGNSRGILGLFKKHNIRYIHGRAEIDAPGTVKVNIGQGQTETIAWDRLLIATGTAPLNIPAFAFDGRRILSSNDALGLTRVPASMVIVGGGVIGCEFAFILAALGTQVTVVEALERLLPLPSVDENCSKLLQREMKKRKINFLLKRTVNGCDDAAGQLKVHIGPSPYVEALSPKEKEPLTVSAEKMLVCIGRSPNSSGIGLETLGIAVDDKGWITADDHMRTNVPGVYAIGDILGPDKVMLAHVASTEGLIAAENIMGGDRTMDYHAVPGAIFTSPEVANVGLTQRQAAEQGRDVQAASVLFRAVGKAQVIGEIAGEAKLVFDAGSKEVLGVHMIGPHVTDLIAEATLAVGQRLTVDELGATIHAHPTLAEIMLEVAHKAQGHAIHG